MRFYAVLRISSLPIPLVNLTDLCKKFGTCWHTCAKTCAKLTISQIYLYNIKLNRNNMNCIYNFRNFMLFPFVSVLLSSIWDCCSYFPMQNIFLTPIYNLISAWYIVHYEVLLKGKSSFGGTDWGLHFCKETNKICKNALFLEFLAYLHFVAW